MPKVVICIPTITKPYQACLDSLAASVPMLEAAGWEHAAVYEIGCPYISHARAKMLRKALDAGADAIVFIDHDLSWQPDAIVRLLQVEREVVAGTYRFKKEPEEYMGAVVCEADGKPVERHGCLEMSAIPAGFLKITRSGVNRFMRNFPELVYDEASHPSVDLFNHGACNGVWWGEDYAFARRWRERCGRIWLVPDINLHHHTANVTYAGNFHEFLRRQPGGDLAQAA